MQDISQMSFGMQPRQNQPQKNGGGKHSYKMVVVVIVGCVVIAVLAILLLMTKVSKNGTSLTEKEEEKVREAVEIYVGVLQRVVSLAEVQWEEYYPDEVAEQMQVSEEEMEEYQDKPNGMEGIKIKILSVSKIDSDNKDAGKYLQDILQIRLDELPDIDLDEDEIRAEEGYLVLSRFEHDEYEGEEHYSFFLVLKVDGRYGIYGMYGGDMEDML